eukprot:CAMPEP_0117034604 /NCGR_PEP_ID=MMETSP0472-20121206/24626_1 /TAXON_ID=693140 ORGANISM="Tiarina fusus, Strain LIS" /NCGR_SAMPLE_ID=MMETSP0472 /ASSEMBLY_ACC=CAM_ASM_000603 /LENGTH=114 /DNA_ID=CAMNT_0004743823 /DNA_START=324 /DNA_END=665 /DNA_ORIENTATION=-
MKPQFLGTSYHVLTRNCNHFSEALCKELLAKGVPSYVNRLSWLGTFVQCLLPPEFQANVADQVPAPNNVSRFPGSASVLKEGNVPPSSASVSQEEIALRRERCAEAALKRLQNQ